MSVKYGCTIAIVISVAVGDRFDCFPESGASKTLCEARGCLWNESTIVDNEPYCYYPNDYGYYYVKNLNDDEISSILIESSHVSINPYGNDFEFVNVLINEETSSRIRITMNNNNKTISKKRYRVPIDFPIENDNNNSSSSDNKLYDVNSTMISSEDVNVTNDIFGIKIIRQSSNSILFNSQMPGLILSDQFLQLNVQFAQNSRLFGWGERFSGLELPKNYTTVASFSHDVVDYLTYQNSYGMCW